MKNQAGFPRRAWCTALVLSCLVLFARHYYVYGQDKSDFPDGFDAVQAAPKSHRVIFENALVRVLEVSVLPGTTVPMHHHRWPSLLLTWDTGGKTPHIHYRRQDGSVRDIPSTNEAIHPGAWSAHWMGPEPMHAIEILEAPDSKGLQTFALKSNVDSENQITMEIPMQCMAIKVGSRCRCRAET